MAFRVTQCPSCESTFNTSQHVLEAAAGKVRCGACLTVFSAADNFIVDEQAEPAESVFVSSIPVDFFDPSSFLTRGALRETGLVSPMPDLADDAVAREAGSQSDPQADSQSDPQADPDTHEFLAAVSDILDEEHPVEPQATEDGNEEQWRGWPAFAIAESGTTESPRPADAAPQWLELRLDPEGLAAPPWLPGATPTRQRAVSAAADSATELDTAAMATAAHTLAPPAAVEAPVAFSLHYNFTVSAGAEPPAQGRPDPTAISLSWSGSLEASGDDTAAAPAADATHAANAAPVANEAPVADEAPAANNTEPTAQHEPLADFNEETQVRDFQDTIAGELDTETPGTPPQDTGLESDYLELDDHRDASEEAVTAAEDTDDPAKAGPSVAAIRARALQAELEDEEALDAIPQENLAALRQFSSPVEFLAGRSRRWRRQAGWTALALALAALLAAQYLWQEMPTYSQSPRLRPFYASVCALAGCDLPTYSAVGAIRSDILTVRSHPAIDNALAVNVEFRNTAPFPQPFPVMVLSFNTASNSIMALREFAPSEYLDPVLARRGLMPVMNPVQVSLEIIDPGADAVNYTLAFRRP
ncbi:MAG: DUF3426 domain-containing protein [Pseudohongiellaceae bacterium]